MLKNYLTIAIRNLMRYKAYSFINISGLAVGMACLILVLLFIQNEFRYNTHHPNADRIYRVVIDFGNDKASGATSGALGPAVNTELPDIEIATRFFKDFPEILYECWSVRAQVLAEHFYPEVRGISRREWGVGN